MWLNVFIAPWSEYSSQQVLKSIAIFVHEKNSIYKNVNKNIKTTISSQQIEILQFFFQILLYTSIWFETLTINIYVHDYIKLLFIQKSNS